MNSPDLSSMHEFVLEVARRRYPDHAFLLFYGSASRGTNRPDSDIDISVLYEKKIRPFREIFSVNGKVFDALVHDFETINFELCTSKQTGTTAIIDIIRSATPLPHPTPFSEYLLNTANSISNVPVDFDKDKLRLFLSNLLKDLRRSEDDFEKNALSVDLYRLLSDYVFLKNGRSAISRKYANTALKNFDPDFHLALNTGFNECITTGNQVHLLALGNTVLAEIGGELGVGYKATTSEYRLPLPEDLLKETA